MVKLFFHPNHKPVDQENSLLLQSYYGGINKIYIFSTCKIDLHYLCSHLWTAEMSAKSLKQSFIIDYLSILVSVKIIINMPAVIIRIKTVLIWWPSLKLTYLFYSMNTTLIRGTYNYNFFHLIRNLIPGTKQIYLSESSSSSSSDTLHSGSSSRSTIMASISGTAISLIIWSLS